MLNSWVLGKNKILLFLKQKRLMLFPKEGLQFQGILIISSIVPLQKEDEDTLLAPEDASAPVPIDEKPETVHNEEHPPTEATESASTSVPIDSVDDEQPDLTKTAEDAPTPIPKDPFTVIIEDSSTLEVEEVSMLSVISIAVEVEDSTLFKGLFAYL